MSADGSEDVSRPATVSKETGGKKPSPPPVVTKDRKTPGVSVRMTLLPEDFQPSEHDVLCGRGGVCKNWPGNVAYRELVQSKLEEYAAADTRQLKGVILDDIVKHVRQKAGVGGFVKKDEQKQRWYEVGDFLAREKTSQCFRDALHDQYTSSAHAKYQRRKWGGNAKSDSKPTKASNSAAKPKKETMSQLSATGGDKPQQPPNQLRHGHTPGPPAEARAELPSSPLPSAPVDAQESTLRAFLNSSSSSSASQADLQRILDARNNQLYNRDVLGSLGLGIPPSLYQQKVAMQGSIIESLRSRLAPTAGTALLSDLHSSNTVFDAARIPQLSHQQIQLNRALHGLTGGLTLAGAPLDQSHLRDPRWSLQGMSQMEASDFLGGLKKGSAAANSKSDSQERTVRNDEATHPKPTSEQQQMESVCVCVLQPNLRADDETLYEATQRVVKMMADAAKEKVDLFVLPELSPCGYSEHTFRELLPNTPVKQELYKQVDAVLSLTAVKLQCYISYGTIGWKLNPNGSDTRFFIRQNVIDRKGSIVASYDKIHLCDYGDCAETRFFDRGDSHPSVFEVNGFRFGTMICADIRYPMLSRRLAADLKADVLLQPSAFVRDLSFRTWKSFRETRAVENSVYFIAVNYAGEKFGESSIVPPWVDESNEPVVASTSECTLVHHIKRSRLIEARTSMPFYNQMMVVTQRERGYKRTSGEANLDR